MKKIIFSLSAVLCLMLNVAGVGLQKAEAADAPFPTKSIDIIVPAGAGGGTDMIARALANKAKDILGKPVVIVNNREAAVRSGLPLGRQPSRTGIP